MTDLEYTPQEEQIINQQLTNMESTLPSRDPLFSQWLLNLSEELQKIQHLIRGDTLNYENSEWETTETPHINKRGLSVVIANISSCATRISPMTQYDSEEINKKLFEFYETLLNNLFDNIQEYELDLTQFESILDISVSFVQDIYNAAKSGQIREFFKSVKREDVRQIVNNQNQKQETKKWGI